MDLGASTIDYGITGMQVRAIKSTLKTIQPFRALFLQENNFQIRYNACHERNWADSYLISQDGVPIGYGSVKGKENLTDRDSVFEFYIIPPYRNNCRTYFSALLIASRASFIESQTNEELLTSMLYEFSVNIHADVILLKEHVTTNLQNPGVVFRVRKSDDSVFEHKVEPVGEYILEHEGEIVATGGYMVHYNYPFADLFMEVREDCRRRGFASFLLQEVKKECYKNGRVPAARCNIDNVGSRSSLVKAGLQISGYMLAGEVKN